MAIAGVSPPLGAVETAVAEMVPVGAAPAGTPVAETASPPGEGSMIGRFVALLTPVFVVAAGWLAGRVAQLVPGAHLNQGELVAFMIAVATAALAAAWKWLQGLQQHERLVAEGRAQALRKPQASK